MVESEGPRAVIHVGDSRVMKAVAEAGVDLVVTSPPYWHIKDYGRAGQIGHGQSLHEYLRDLYSVWRECGRVLGAGGRLCVNIGDQFARSTVYGRYRVIPLHAEIIRQCELSGFDYLGSVIWRKRTTMNTSGGAVVMGSYPYPPNGIVELDYEFILLFRKPGKPRKVPASVKKLSALTKEEWKTWFSGHWSFPGARKSRGHEAEFPEELPRRLIRMFSFRGDTVLDPFMGSGTTARAGLALGRNVIGYEVNEEYARAALERTLPAARSAGGQVVLVPAERGRVTPDPGYVPGVADARPPAEAPQGPRLFTVRRVEPDCTLVLDDANKVRLLGVHITDPGAARAYLLDRVAGKRVFLKDETPARSGPGGECRAYVYMKNRIFVNAHLLKEGMGKPDGSEHRLASRFRRLEPGSTPPGQ
jgi:modification methylase